MEVRHVPYFLLVLLVLLQGTLGAKTPPIKLPPNLIFLMIDDLGWANIGYHNPYLEPNVTQTLVEMAAQGIRFERHYTYPLCGPTRSSLLTGRNPIHVNPLMVQFNHDETPPVNAQDRRYSSGVPLGIPMISDRLRSAGYRTYHTGKWDVGWATRDHLPINRGFDASFGYLHHANDHWSFIDEEAPCARDLWRNNAPASDKRNPDHCSQANQVNCTFQEELFVADVLHNLRHHSKHHADKPFFYYYAMHSVHTPLQVPQRYLEKFWFIENSDRRYYSAMVKYMDDQIKKIKKELEDLGMWDNTVIVVSSDNGGPVYGDAASGVGSGGANNYPLRGGKGSSYEGGIRVNAFASGGYLNEKVRGTISEDLIGIEDWYATFCSLAGIKNIYDDGAAEGLPKLDSIDMSPILRGLPLEKPRLELPIGICPPFDNYFFVQGVIRCAAKGNCLKLLIGENYMNFWQGPQYPNKSTNYNAQDQLISRCGDRGCLFNISGDPNEYEDLADDLAHELDRFTMRDRLAYWQSTIFNVYRGAAKPLRACEMAQKDYDGFYGPFSTINTCTSAHCTL